MKILGFLAIATLSQPADAAPPQCNEGFTTVVHEQYSGVHSQGVMLIEDGQTLCAVWDQIYSNIYPPPGCDTGLIDFSNQVAVVAALGSRPDGCYDIDVGCVHRTPNNTIGVGIVETQPGPDCICTDAIVDPVIVIAIDRPVTDVKFRAVVRELECP